MSRIGRSFPVRTIMQVYGDIIPSTYVDTNTVLLTLDPSQTVEQYVGATYKQTLTTVINFAVKRASTW